MCNEVTSCSDFERETVISHTSQQTSAMDDDYEKLRKEYRVSLDEISALLERVNELQDQLDKVASTASRPGFVAPVSVNLKDSTTFEKRVLSMCMYGVVEGSPPDLTRQRIQTKFSGNDMHRNQLDFLSKFPPLILEDIRHKIVKALQNVDNINTVVGKIDFTPKMQDAKEIAPQTNKKRNSKANKVMQQPNLDFATIQCSTDERYFPKLEHGFNMELLCVMLPNYRKGKKVNFILAIGSRVSASIDEEEEQNLSKEREVTYTIRMLTHDYTMLYEHACNVFRHRYPGKEVLNPLMYVEWHHLMGLIPDARMYEATRPEAPFLFTEQMLLHKPVPWPQTTRQVEFRGLNAIQAKVVQALAHTNERGMFHLIGPPGTGKTTTITQLLLERVRRFPYEKILLTAPSNKAIHVVLRKLVESSNKNGHAVAIAVIGSEKVALPEHEELYASSYTVPFIRRFRQQRHRYKDINAVRQAKQSLRQIARDIAEKYSLLLSSPGMSIDDSDDEGEDADALYYLQEKFQTESIEHLWDEKDLHKYITECISRLSEAAYNVDNVILRKAHIVFGTLVASGRKSLLRVVPRFDTVIVDEASQALMPATFIPFMYHPARYILVGDPQQLPATVQADHLKPLGYADSLMLVMQREMGAQSCAMMLTTQYRMHPAICKPISDLFYEGKLVTDDSVINRTCLIEKHLPKDMLLHGVPSVFIDLDSAECRIGDGSTYNTDEAELVVNVVMYLLDHGVGPAQIGVVSGYAAQVSLLKSLLNKAERLRPRPIDLHKLAISTVDGFQGDEKDFMLFSCVRTGSSVGFLSDARRINVAMSRGRHANWVFGQARTLSASNSSIRDFLSWSTDNALNCAMPLTRTIKAEDLLKSMETPRHAPVPVATVAHMDRENTIPVNAPHSAFAQTVYVNAHKPRQQYHQNEPRYQQNPRQHVPLVHPHVSAYADNLQRQGELNPRPAPPLRLPYPHQPSHYMAQEPTRAAEATGKRPRDQTSSGARGKKRNARHVEINDSRHNKRPHIV